MNNFLVFMFLNIILVNVKTYLLINFKFKNSET